MIINHCFKVRSLILTAALIGGLSLVNHANAQQVGSYLIDLNSGTVTNLGRGPMLLPSTMRDRWAVAIKRSEALFLMLLSPALMEWG